MKPTIKIIMTHILRLNKKTDRDAVLSLNIALGYQFIFDIYLQLLPLNRPRGLAGNVIDDAVNAANFINNPRCGAS